MSTSLLYHAFGVRGYRYRRTEHDGGMTLFHVESQDKAVCCSSCGSRNVIRRGSKERWFRSLPIGSRLTWVVADIPRYAAATRVPVYMWLRKLVQQRMIDAHRKNWLRSGQPFQPANQASSAGKLLRDSPQPLRKLRPSMPRDLCTIIEKQWPLSRKNVT